MRKDIKKIEGFETTDGTFFNNYEEASFQARYLIFKDILQEYDFDFYDENSQELYAKMADFFGVDTHSENFESLDKD